MRMGRHGSDRELGFVFHSSQERGRRRVAENVLDWDLRFTYKCGKACFFPIKNEKHLFGSGGEQTVAVNGRTALRANTDDR